MTFYSTCSTNFGISRSVRLTTGGWRKCRQREHGQECAKQLSLALGAAKAEAQTGAVVMAASGDLAWSLAKSVGLCLGGVWGGGLQMQMQMLFVVHFRWLSAALFLLDAWWFVVAARIGCVRDVRLRRAALSLVNNWNWNSSKLLCGCGSRWMKVFFSLPRSIYQGDRDIVVLYSKWTI